MSSNKNHLKLVRPTQPTFQMWPESTESDEHSFKYYQAHNDQDLALAEERMAKDLELLNGPQVAVEIPHSQQVDNVVPFVIKHGS